MGCLINASGAKGGGAREILRSLIAHLPEKNCVVACPKIAEFETDHPRIKFVQVETDGWRSAVFTLFGAARLAKRNDCQTILSLMNFNVVFKKFKRITYLLMKCNDCQMFMTKSQVFIIIIFLRYLNAFIEPF